MSEEDIILIDELYKNNYRTTEIINIIGSSCSTINRALRKLNNPPPDASLIQQKYSINQEYFKVIDTEQKAYILGLLYADGNIYPKDNKISISLQYEDQYMLHEINTILESNRPLYYIPSKIKKFKNREYLCKEAYALVITNRDICSDLLKLGMHPKKSLTLKFPTNKMIPPHLLHHFIRGVFDGDGSVGYVGKNIRFKITSTFEFLSSLQDILVKELDLNKILLYNTSTDECPTKVLAYAGLTNCDKIYNWLYKDATIYFKRKHEKFIEIINSKKFTLI